MEYLDTNSREQSSFKGYLFLSYIFKVFLDLNRELSISDKIDLIFYNKAIFCLN